MPSGSDWWFMADKNRIEGVENWLKAENIDNIECMVADNAGVARGKSISRKKFLEGVQNRQIRIPETLFGMTISGDFALNDHMSEIERDVMLEPDLNTICTTPWQPEPTANVICDAVHENGDPVVFSPRQTLQRVLKLYEDEGWRPIVAPEFEFYLLDKQETAGVGPKAPAGMSGQCGKAASPYNIDTPDDADDVPTPEAPIGASGSRDQGSALLSIDSLDEFSPFFKEVYSACETQRINIDTLTHEAGAGQFEFNVEHGPALGVADQSFLFKRLVKQIATRHNMFASFMASPYPNSFGSSMHIHQSVECIESGKNIFVTSDGGNSELFLQHIAGLQKYLQQAMPLIAPYVNSYRRFTSELSAPTNTHWSRENRSVGLRVPSGPAEARRIENRVAGSDTNPYFAIATSLACGYLGMKEALKPSQEFDGSAYETQDKTLPRHFLDGLKNMRQCDALKDVLGEAFVETFIDSKELEYENYSSVLSPWETKNLLLTV